MTAATHLRLTEAGPPIPAMGTLPSAANQLFHGRTLVSRDGSGNAVVPSDGDGLGVQGVCNATYDNRTGSEAGGLAGDINVEMGYGVFGFDFVSADGTPEPGDKLYAVDNQTVSVAATSATGAPRGVAGICSEVRPDEGGTNQCFVFVGPLALALAAGLDGFQSVDLPTLPAWTDNVANGYDPATVQWTLNPTIDDEPILASVALPDDFDGTAPCVVSCRAAISSVATDDDVVMLLVAKFDGGADVAPASTTVLSVAFQEIHFVIPAGSVPDGARSLGISLRCANTLDTADGYVQAIWLNYKRAQ